jgi:hypothetical protein
MSFWGNQIDYDKYNDSEEGSEEVKKEKPNKKTAK